MLETILVIVALITLCAAAYTDLNTHEVPDWISFGFIIVSLGVRALLALFAKDLSIFLDGIFGFVVFFGISYILYRASQWGGADGKLLGGMGAVLGLSSHALLFVILVLFLGALYGIIWSIYLALKNKHVFVKHFKALFREFKLVVYSISALFIASLFSFVVISDIYLAFLVFAVASIMLIGIITFLFVKAVEDSCLYKKVSSRELTEGDWLAETVMINGKVIASAKDPGVTMEQIRMLRNYRKPITIKIGVPFVPAFLLAFIALLLLKYLGLRSISL